MTGRTMSETKLEWETHPGTTCSPIPALQLFFYTLPRTMRKMEYLNIGNRPRASRPLIFVCRMCDESDCECPRAVAVRRIFFDSPLWGW